MKKEEFIKKATELGYSQEMIDEELELYEEAKQDGVKIPLGKYLDELPKD